jgi:hypothetical protein
MGRYYAPGFISVRAAILQNCCPNVRRTRSVLRVVRGRGMEVVFCVYPIILLGNLIAQAISQYLLNPEQKIYD